MNQELDLLDCLDCPICMDHYDSDNKKPTSLIPCCHTICQSCRIKLNNIKNFQQSFLCPFDNQKVQDFNTNWTLLRIVIAHPNLDNRSEEEQLQQFPKLQRNVTSEQIIERQNTIINEVREQLPPEDQENAERVWQEMEARFQTREQQIEHDKYLYEQREAEYRRRSTCQINLNSELIQKELKRYQASILQDSPGIISTQSNNSSSSYSSNEQIEQKENQNQQKQQNQGINQENQQHQQEVQSQDQIKYQWEILKTIKDKQNKDKQRKRTSCACKCIIM